MTHGSHSENFGCSKFLGKIRLEGQQDKILRPLGARRLVHGGEFRVDGGAAVRGRSAPAAAALEGGLRLEAGAGPMGIDG